MTWVELAALPALAFWLLLTLDRRRRWPSELRLPSSAPHPPKSPDRVVAVVPARDEAALLPRTLPALLAQGPPLERVILVDDDSRDGTAEVAREAARKAGLERCLRVVAAPPPPPGWTGKLNALARGLETLESERTEGAEEGSLWLLFTDADIQLRPGSLAALVATGRGWGREQPFDLVSVMARLRAGSIWERLLIPPFVFFFQLLYPFRRVSRSGSRVAAAAGGCILLRAEALERAGGLAGIRGAVIDDVALARRVKASGGRIWLGLDPGIESLRSDRGLQGIWRMVSRTAFVQLGRSHLLTLLTVAALAVLVVAPPVVAALAAGRLLPIAGGASPSPIRALVAALAAWALQGAALLPAVRHHGVAGVWSLTLPASGLLYALMTAASAWGQRGSRGPRWKDRTYPRL